MLLRLFTFLSVVALAGLPVGARAVGQALPEDCYLFAYFYHHAEGDGLRLAWSRDGFAWQMLNHGKPCLQPVVGEARLMRDPCLYLGPDGRFHLVWTTGWRGRTIGYASSTDLLVWSAQKELPVMAHEAQAVNCWAPEIVWDESAQCYVIFWSSTILGRFRETENSNKGPDRNHRIYATTTKDFESFTPTRLLYDGGFNVIDATLARDGDRWLMFVKNETAQPKLEKNIRMISAPSLDGPFSAVSEALTGKYWAEGPSAIKVGDEWRVYFDKHRENKYGVVVSRDLTNWVDLSDRTSFPKDARHGTVIAVPGTVVERMLAAQSQRPKPAASAK